MALEKQGLNIPFGQGLDTKTDPNQVAAGKMLALSNVVFDNGGQLHKRNGFGLYAALPITTNTVLSTHNQNLISTGKDLYAYNRATEQWSNRGTVQPVDINVTPLVRNAANKANPSSAVAANGLICTAYGDAGNNYYYQIIQNGQIVKAETAMPANGFSPIVFLLGNNFCIVYVLFSGGNYNLKALTIPAATPLVAGTTTVLQATTLVNAIYWGATVANNTLYFAWADTGTTSVQVNYMTSALGIGTARDTLHGTTQVSVTADTSGSLPIIWVSTNDASNRIYTSAWAWNLAATALLAAVLVVTTTNPNTYLTNIATGNIATLFYSTYTTSTTLYIAKHTVTLAGVASAATIIRRSVGVASTPFYLSSGVGYIFSLYTENDTSYQPTYFLLDFSGNIIARLAQANASILQGGPAPVPVVDDVVYFSYVLKDFITSINKTNGGVQAPGGLFSLNGISLAQITINASPQYSSEIGGSLHLTGGQLWQYDGTTPVEHGFHVYPEGVSLAKSNSTGTIANGTYYYICTYEWTDAAGNIHRSAPSLPKIMVLGGAEDTITVTIPTLRLTVKSGVRLVTYRWSLAQPVYYMVSSISAPTLNDTTVDTVQFVDLLPDSSILGNTLLYTTGGVIENIAAPASSASTLFRNRLFLVDAEDRNTIWFSKTVLAATPVELSDLLTIFVAPTSGAQGSTGPITALSSMDDKLIIFKKDAIYYVTGTGPDATGANNDFSEPVYISGTAGCANQKSIVQTPQGLMFQSDKGIWLLGRDLSTSYIGAPMEAYNGVQVTSALTIPATNQVRFTLENNSTLVYDYYFQQWATFSNLASVSGCLFGDMHTLLNSFGQVLRETPGVYLDNSTPVCISFTTAWLKLTNLQGFQRAYFFYFLGNYASPHKLNISMAYDYNPAITQSSTYTPPNRISVYGADTLYGSDTYGGSGSSVEQFRVFLTQQRCQAVAITVQEQYDSTKGAAAGAGLSLSGINFVVGAKKGFPVLPAKQSIG